MVCNDIECDSRKFAVLNYVELISSNRYGIGQIINKIKQPVYKSYLKEYNDFLLKKEDYRAEQTETVYLIKFMNEFYPGVVYEGEIRHHVFLPGDIVIIKGDSSKGERDFEVLITKMDSMQKNTELVTYMGVKKEKNEDTIEFNESEIKEISTVKPVQYLQISGNPVDIILHAWIQQINSEFFADVLVSNNLSNVTEYDYQISAALELLKNNRTRMILGDDVGLGKTIELGLYLSDLFYRQKARRVLAIMKKSLIVSFQKKMRDIFGIETISDGDNEFEYDTDFGTLKIDRKTYIKNKISEYQTFPTYKVNEVPCFFYVCSLGLFGERSLNKLKHIFKVPWDVIIVDEAHNIRQNVVKKKQNYEFISRLNHTQYICFAYDCNSFTEPIFGISIFVGIA